MRVLHRPERHTWRKPFPELRRPDRERPCAGHSLKRRVTVSVIHHQARLPEERAIALIPHRPVTQAEKRPVPPSAQQMRANLRPRLWTALDTRNHDLVGPYRTLPFKAAEPVRLKNRPARPIDDSHKSALAVDLSGQLINATPRIAAINPIPTETENVSFKKSVASKTPMPARK